MAGSSNRFLTPSHFTQTGGQILGEGQKTNILVPPSLYQKKQQDIVVKSVEANRAKEAVVLKNENLDLRKKVEKLLEEKRGLCLEKEQGILQKNKREMAVESELHLARRKICDLEQEKEILQFELEDKESLSVVVLKLKKELKKCKDKFGNKEKAMGEEIEKCSEVIKHLKRAQKENETAKRNVMEEISNLKDVCAKQGINVKELEEKNYELLKALEIRKKEFEKILCDKENEKNKITAKCTKEQEFFERNFKELEEENKKMNENVRKMDEINKMNEDEKRVIEVEKREIENKIKSVENELVKEKEKRLHLENDAHLKGCKIIELENICKKMEDDVTEMDVKKRNMIEKMKQEYEENIDNLEKILQSKDNVFQKEQNICAENIQSKEDEIKELSQTVKQLRSYIGDVRPSEESEKLKETNRQLTRTIEILTEENNALQSTVKLLNVRLSAILEIVAIQENELTRNDGTLGNMRDTQGLLRRWREKVFALMIQLRSQEIVEQNQKREEKNKVDDLNSKVEDLQSECRVLQHKLTDKEAALELETNLRQTTGEELEKLKENIKVLRNQQNQCLMQLQSLHKTAEHVENIVLQSLTSIKKSLSKIPSYGERIKFAGCRIHFITEYMNHRDSNMKKSERTCDHDDDDVNSEDVLSKDGEQHLKEEVEKLLKERDLLLSKTKKHNEVLQQETQLITEQYERIIEEKNEKLQKLEKYEVDMKEKLNALNNRLETKSSELEEALENIEELKLTLSKEKNTLEKAHRQTLEKERLQYVEDMRSIEGQLNEVRREHAKAIMALKSSERQVSLEKEQSSKMVANIERELNEKLAKCQKQLNNVEKERNLLMVRIKEDKKNVPRVPPLKGNEHTKKITEFPLVKQADTQKHQKSSSNKTSVSLEVSGDNEGEPVQSMDPNEAFVTLKELKMLSEQIIKIREIPTSDSEK